MFFLFFSLANECDHILTHFTLFFSLAHESQCDHILTHFPLFFSLSHECDHIYMAVTYDHPPDDICATFAVFLCEFVMAQTLVVCFMAINSFVMVVLEKKIDLGNRDWRLLVLSFGGPMLFIVPIAALDYLGPAGAWYGYNFMPVMYLRHVFFFRNSCIHF